MFYSVMERRYMNNTSAKVDELAQRLARVTGEETALQRAIEERLARLAATITRR
jgi:hypothetical protein